MDQLTSDALKKWKRYLYRPTDIPFIDVVGLLTAKPPVLEVRQSDTRKTDWEICLAGTATPATFVFAGVFAQADPYETGNFVWGKAPVPDGLEESRVARIAGFKAAYSYAIETFHDKDIWELQADLDQHMTSVHGFNTREVKRREWQNGSTWHVRYWFRSPMFLTCETRGGHPEAPEGLHDWVVAAHKKSNTYRANPLKPEVFGLEGGRLRRIRDCTPNVLEYGDVISIVFHLAFVEDRDDWGPVPTLTHVVRVQRANRDAYQLTSTLVVGCRPPDTGALCLGAIVDEEQAAKADAASLEPTSSTVAEPALAPASSATSRTALSSVVAAAPGTGASLGGSLQIASASPLAVVSATNASKTGGDLSGSEMDVDDDNRVLSRGSRQHYHGVDKGPGDALQASTDAERPGSRGSTITDDSTGPPSVITNVKSAASGKKRDRSHTDEDDNGHDRLQRGRGISSGGIRRGGKGKGSTITA